MCLMSKATTHPPKNSLSCPTERAYAGKEDDDVNHDAPLPTKDRIFGTLKGRIAAPASFFDPLPEEELNLWEGK
jgi:hypothetical protein